MSVFVGPISGALVAGGIYYGFSNLIQTRTVQHRSDLHTLSRRLVEASTVVPSPPPASARLTHHPFTSILKEQWNQSTATIYRKVRSWDDGIQEWGRKVMSGGQETRKDQS